MKNLKLGLISFLISNVVFARPVIGIGEYNYGPETSENIACQMAEDRAKEHALTKFLGEEIKIVVSEDCKNEDCTLNQETNKEVKGAIKNILDRKISHTKYLGHKTCTVTIKAEVERIVNQIKFEIFGKYPHYKHGDTIRFAGLTNKKGFVYIFNKYDGSLNRIHTQNNVEVNKKFFMPSSTKEEIVAILPDGQKESREMLIFLFSEEAISVQANYTQDEFNTLLRSLPFDKHRVINQYVYIMRSL